MPVSWIWARFLLLAIVIYSSHACSLECGRGFFSSRYFVFYFWKTCLFLLFRGCVMYIFAMWCVCSCVLTWYVSFVLFIHLVGRLRGLFLFSLFFLCSFLLKGRVIVLLAMYYVYARYTLSFVCTLVLVSLCVGVLW